MDRRPNFARRENYIKNSLNYESMISQKTKYAIRAILYLSLNRYNADLVSGIEVAKELKIPAPFTVKILQELARNGIISSTKGPRGGFHLTEKNIKLPLLRVLEAMDDTAFFNTCALGLAVCSSEHPCPIHNTIKEVRKNLLHVFYSKTIKDISAEIIEHQFCLVK